MPRASATGVAESAIGGVTSFTISAGESAIGAVTTFTETFVGSATIGAAPTASAPISVWPAATLSVPAGAGADTAALAALMGTYTDIVGDLRIALGAQQIGLVLACM